MAAWMEYELYHERRWLDVAREEGRREIAPGRDERLTVPEQGEVAAREEVRDRASNATFEGELRYGRDVEEFPPFTLGIGGPIARDRDLTEAELAAETDGVASEAEAGSAAGMSEDVYGRAVEPQPAMALVKRSPKRTANWALAIAHAPGGILHSFSARFKTRNRSFSAASSVGKWPRARTARRSLELSASMAFVTGMMLVALLQPVGIA